MVQRLVSVCFYCG